MPKLSQDVREVFLTALKFPEYKTEFLNEMDSLRDGVNQALSGGSGTVTSVGLSLPSIFTVSNSPVTVTGTLTAVLASQTQNKFFASPNGSSGAPTFRAILAADIPTLNQNTTGSAASLSATLVVTSGGTGQTSYTNGQLLIGNTTGNTLVKSTLTAGSGISIVNGAGSITISTSGGSGANTALSNLAAVDINSDLLTSSAVNIGSDTLLFNNGYIATMYSGGYFGTFGGGGGGSAILSSSDNSGPGAGGDTTITTGAVQSADDTGNIFINTHNASGGTAISGNILNTSGTSSGGNSGYNSLRTGNAVISGNIDITTGSGSSHRGDISISGRNVSISAVTLISMNNKLDMGSNLINNVSDPVDQQDAATKQYVDLVVFDDSSRAHSSTTTISGTLATIVYSTEDYDSNGGYNNTTGIFTAGFTGKYNVKASLLFSGTIALNNTVIMEIQKNNSVWARRTIYLPAALTDGSISIADDVKCTAGDTIRIQVSTNSTSPAIVASAFDNYLSIAKVS